MNHATHTRRTSHRRLGGAITVLALTATACGGGSGDADGTSESIAPVSTAAPAQTESAGSEPESTDSDPVATDATEAAPVDTALADESVVSDAGDAPADTAAAPSGAIDLADIGVLVQLHADAYESGIDPLQVAVDLSGFPVDQQPPADGPFFNFRADVKAGSDGRLRVDWEYGIENASASDYTLEPGRTIPSGPPLDLITDTYVEQWAADGLVYQNEATYSDDDHPTGQGNTQLYYGPESQDSPVVEIPTPAGVGQLTTVGAAAWGDFDDGNAIAGETPQPGYVQFVSASFEQGVVPVPIIAGLLEAVPTTAGMELSSADLYTKLADPEGPFGEFGARSMFLRVKFEAPAADFDAVTAHYAANPFDPTLIRYARIDSFAETPTAQDDTFGTDADRPSVKLLLNDTYPGSIFMSKPDADDETFNITVEFNLEPLRTPLA